MRVTMALTRPIIPGRGQIGANAMHVVSTTIFLPSFHRRIKDVLNKKQDYCESKRMTEDLDHRNEAKLTNDQ